MMLLWRQDIPYWQVALPLCFLGAGVGLAGTPSSNSLTGSAPVTRVGMASGTADLQRDLGGALMTSIFGALLTAGYALAMETAISESGKNITERTQSQLQLSFASAVNLAANNPRYANQITAAAQQSFLDGDQWGVPGGDSRRPDWNGARVPLLPEQDEEEDLRASYLAADTEVSP